MRMPPFRFERPTELRQALELFRDPDGIGNGYVLSAGGTDIVPMMKSQPVSVGTLISLTKLKALGGIRLDPGKSLSLGALVTLAGLSSDTTVREAFPCIAETAGKIATPQIRNRATVGGNLLVDNRCIYFNQSEQNRLAHTPCFKAGGEACHLVPKTARGDDPLCRARSVSDLAPVLLLLRATIRIVSAAGERSLPLHDFYLPDGIFRNRLDKGEILTRIDVPLPGPSAGILYEKLRIRNAIDFPSLGVAASLDRISGGGTRFGVALTGVHTRPVVGQVDVAARGSWEEPVNSLIAEISREVTPFRQGFFPPDYLRKMIPVLIRRNVEKLLGKA